jgi:hypothetical protein
VPQRVVDQRAPDLQHAALVGQRAHPGLEREAGDGRRAALADRREVRGQGRSDLGEVDGLALQGHTAGVQPREVEQVGREARQPRHLVAHGAEELLPRLRVDALVL